jgi:hypothetical protein
MSDVGRPTKYKPEFVAQAEKLCRLGATDLELADFFEVDVRTIYRWKAEHDEFCQALKAGKDVADERVERSLYAKAIGYQFDAVKIMQYEGVPMTVPYREHVPPDTTACIFWLKNRRAEQWRDKVESLVSVKREVSAVSDDELADIATGGGAGTADAPESPQVTH